MQLGENWQCEPQDNVTASDARHFYVFAAALDLLEEKPNLLGDQRVYEECMKIQELVCGLTPDRIMQTWLSIINNRDIESLEQIFVDESDEAMYMRKLSPLGVLFDHDIMSACSRRAINREMIKHRERKEIFSREREKAAEIARKFDERENDYPLTRTTSEDDMSDTDDIRDSADILDDGDDIQSVVHPATPWIPPVISDRTRKLVRQILKSDTGKGTYRASLTLDEHRDLMDAARELKLVHGHVIETITSYDTSDPNAMYETKAIATASGLTALLIYKHEIAKFRGHIKTNDAK
jgi:hypothetical protein